MSTEKPNNIKDSELFRVHKKLQNNIVDVPEVKELLALFKNNKLDTQAKNFGVLLASVDNMKRDIKGAIEQDNNIILKFPFKDNKGVDKIRKATINGSAVRLSVDTFSIKHEILKASESIVSLFKHNGFIALNGNEFDMVKLSLAKFGTRVEENTVAVNKAIDDFSEKTNGAENIHLSKYHETLQSTEDNFITAFENIAVLSQNIIQEPIKEVIQAPKDILVDIGAVQQLINLLEQNHKADKLATVQGLVDTINTIENNLNTAMAQLKTVKAQLENTTITIPQSTVKEVAIQQVSKLESGFKKLKNQLNVIKGKFVGTAQNIVDGVKDTGISALDKTSDFMNLKENLTTLNEGISKNISKVSKNISTINSMTQELNAATKHFKNVGKAMTGKERDGTMAQASEGMVKPLRAVKKLLVNMEQTSANAITSVDKLAKRAGREQTQEDKPSILQKLKNAKTDMSEPKVPNPKTSEMVI